MVNTQTVGSKVKRALSHLIATPFQSRWLNAAALARLEAAIALAERGHRGEIRLCIERSLPFTQSFHLRIRQRAEDMFAYLRIWDTAERNGILIYLNLAEHRLEIVADQGLNTVINEKEWQILADAAVAKLYAKERIEALEALLEDVGNLLRERMPSEDDPNGNELPNQVLLR